jgi:hypothetical protein
MADFDEFASSLLEESKRFLERANETKDNVAQDAYLHAALLLAFCSLEAHINAISVELSDRPEFSTHEKGFLLEKEVRLQEGTFALGGLRMSRLDERILFLHRHFSGKALDTTVGWWSELSGAVAIRNKLTHPKDVQPITVQNVRSALSAVIAAIDNLYKVIYKKGLPAANMALQSRLTF